MIVPCNWLLVPVFGLCKSPLMHYSLAIRLEAPRAYARARVYAVLYHEVFVNAQESFDCSSPGDA